jgi:hypothetical protein
VTISPPSVPSGTSDARASVIESLRQASSALSVSRIPDSARTTSLSAQ